MHVSATAGRLLIPRRAPHRFQLVGPLGACTFQDGQEQRWIHRNCDIIDRCCRHFSTRCCACRHLCADSIGVRISLGDDRSWCGWDPVLPLGPLIVRLSSSIATAAVLRNLDIYVFELFLGVSLQVAGEWAEHRGSGFDQQDVGSWRRSVGSPEARRRRGVRRPARCAHSGSDRRR